MYQCRAEATWLAGLRFCTVFHSNTPACVLTYLKRKHNSFHHGSSTNHVEILMEIPCIEDGWKVRWQLLLKQGITYNALPKSGKGSYGQRISPGRRGWT